MKSIILIALFLISAFANKTFSQNKKVVKTSFWVSGNCEMCKANIEGALDQKGVRSAIWDEKTKMVDIVYDSTRVKSAQIQQWISNKGYETETTAANDSAYEALPGCCKYERKLSVPKK